MTKNGAGVLTLTGTNTYNGSNILTAGTVAISSAGNLGTGGSTSQFNTTNRVFFSNTTTAELRATADLSLGRGVVLGPSGVKGTLSAAPGATLTVDGALTLNSNVTVAFGSAGQSGTVLFNPSSVGLFSSSPLGLVVNAGTLRFAPNSSGGLFLAAKSSIVTVAAGATLDFNGNVANGTQLLNLQGAGTVQSGGTAATNLVIGGGDFAGVLAGPGQITKATSGTLTLSGSNTYTGVTTVSAGTLRVNGSTPAASTVTVSSGAILGGSGTVGGATTVNGGGTLAPGNSPGRLSFGGDLSLPAGSLLDLEVGGLTAGTQYDQVLVAGMLTLGGDLRVTVVNGFTLAPAQSFTIVEDTGNSTVLTPTFANAPGGLYTDAAGNTFLVSLANVDGGAVPNDVTLTVLTVVPEPGTWALLGVGGLVVATTGLRRHPRVAGPRAICRNPRR